MLKQGYNLYNIIEPDKMSHLPHFILYLDTSTNSDAGEGLFPCEYHCCGAIVMPHLRLPAMRPA